MDSIQHGDDVSMLELLCHAPAKQDAVEVRPIAAQINEGDRVALVSIYAAVYKVASSNLTCKAQTLPPAIVPEKYLEK